MAPHKLVLIPHLTELTGAPLTHLEYAKRLADDEQFEVTFVVPDEGPLCSAARDAGLAVDVVENPPGGVREQSGLFGKIGHLMKRKQAKSRLSEYLAEKQPDLVFASSVVNVLPALAARESNIPLVYHLQEPEFSFPDNAVNRKKAETIEQAATLLLTAPGSNKKLFPNAVKVEVHNAVDLSRYDRARRDECRAALLNEFKLAEDMTVVICVASISKRKGIDSLNDASYDLFFRHPKLAILVVGPDGGDAEFAAQMREEAASSDFADRYIFTGPRTDIPNLLLGSDIFVLPTQADAQPLSVIEAMAAGLPIVTTDVGDIPSMLLEGSIGFILPAEDPQSLQVGIEKILDVPEVKDRYVEGTLKRAQDFSYEHALEIVKAELLKLLKK
jgi:glycosyltransferase involved in cell wall biosynthesis